MDASNGPNIENVIASLKEVGRDPDYSEKPNGGKLREKTHPPYKIDKEENTNNSTQPLKRCQLLIRRNSLTSCTST